MILPFERAHRCNTHVIVVVGRREKEETNVDFFVSYHTYCSITSVFEMHE